MDSFLITILPVCVTVAGLLSVLGTLTQIPITHRRSLSQHIMQSRRTIARGVFLATIVATGVIHA